MAMTEDRAEQPFARAEQEGAQGFYVKAPVEFGTLEGQW